MIYIGYIKRSIEVSLQYCTIKGCCEVLRSVVWAQYDNIKVYWDVLYMIISRCIEMCKPNMIILKCIEMYCISPIWYYHGVLRSIEMCKPSPNMILLRCIEMLIEKVATALGMDEAAKIVLSLTHSNWHTF